MVQQSTIYFSSFVFYLKASWIPVMQILSIHHNQIIFYLYSLILSFKSGLSLRFITYSSSWKRELWWELYMINQLNRSLLNFFFIRGEIFLVELRKTVSALLFPRFSFFIYPIHPIKNTMKNYSRYIRKGSVWVLSLHCQSERLTAQRNEKCRGWRRL